MTIINRRSLIKSAGAAAPADVMRLRRLMLVILLFSSKRSQESAMNGLPRHAGASEPPRARADITASTIIAIR